MQAEDRPIESEPDRIIAPAEINTPRSDPLAASLTYLAAHHGRAVSREALLGGLPILDGRLSVALYDRAARRAGLETEAIKRDIADIPAMVLPAVLIMNNGAALILLGIDTKSQSVKVLDPTSGPAAPADRRAQGARRGLYRLRFSGQGRRRSRCARSRRGRSSAKPLVLVGRQGALAQLRAHCAGRVPDQHACAGDALVHHERLRPGHPERRHPLADCACRSAWASRSCSTSCCAPCAAA